MRTHKPKNTTRKPVGKQLITNQELRELYESAQRIFGEEAFPMPDELRTENRSENKSKKASVARKKKSKGQSDGGTSGA